MPASFVEAHELEGITSSFLRSATTWRLGPIFGGGVCKGCPCQIHSSAWNCALCPISSSVRFGRDSITHGSGEQLSTEKISELLLPGAEKSGATGLENAHERGDGGTRGEGWEDSASDSDGCLELCSLFLGGGPSFSPRGLQGWKRMWLEGSG